MLSSFITKIIDFFYPPFRRFIPEEIFRYAACGGGNMFFDWVLYFFVYNFVIGHEVLHFSLFPVPCSLHIALSPHIAALCIVFPVTLFTGFWLNKHITFTASSLASRTQFVRYILIVFVNLLINYFGLKLCVDLIGWYPTPSKVVITILTVIVSFFGQKYFSFRN